MKKTFEKKLNMYELILYYMKNIKWIVLVGILTGILVVGGMYVTYKSNVNETKVDNTIQQTADMELIDGNYICTSLVSIIPANTSDGSQQVQTTTFLSVMISETAISSMIKDLGLEESFIDIFNKMTWSVVGDTIKLTITSPVKEVNGHTWDEVLQNLIEKGQGIIEKNYSISSFIVIDKPYFLNQVKNTQEATINNNVVQSFAISKKNLLIATLISLILASVFLMMKYVCSSKITSPDEVTDNLDIPVLVEIKIL